MAAPTIIATVTRTIPENGYGFAVTDALHGSKLRQVLFSLVDGKKINGSLANPILTTVASDLIPVKGQEVVMEVYRARKGWRARAWGVLPNRDWKRQLLESGELQDFVGGNAHVISQVETISGTVHKIQLENDELTLHLWCAICKFSGETEQMPLSGIFQKTYPLARAGFRFRRLDKRKVFMFEYSDESGNTVIIKLATA